MNAPTANPALAASAGSALAGFSTTALLNELQRRDGDLKRMSPIIPCDECGHWRNAPEGADLGKWNPCNLGHKLSFRVPDSPQDDVWGFYRRNCRDRPDQPSPNAQALPPGEEGGQ